MRLGVVGWPVGHSRSPAIQNAALTTAGLSGWRYQLLPLPSELLEEAVAALPGAGFRGANVTIPHKERIHAMARLRWRVSERARAIGSVNTLVFGSQGGGGIWADNTDAPGLIGALPLSPRGRSAVVLGAGGTARAAVWALLDAGASEVRVWNRSQERARALCEELGGYPVAQPGPADLLVNCTAHGMDGADSLEGLPYLPEDLSGFAVVADFAYRTEGTPLTRAARAAGVATVDGLELLVAQGALSFEQFTGVPAPIGAMRRAVGLPETPAGLSSSA